MNLNLFDQFSIPTLLFISMFPVTILIPTLLFPMPNKKWLTNRMNTLQFWFLQTFTKQIFVTVNMGGYKWFSLLTSLMVFLMLTNLLGLLPYTFTPTTQLSLNLAMAIPLWLMTVLMGLRQQPTASLAHLLPEGAPTPLIPILIIIETASLFIRPMALGVRLTANLTAGHLLIQLISTATMAMLTIMPAVSFLIFIVLLLLTILEIAVAMIQAYVFVLLLTLYLQENT
uniref:ATP synthase subunit a n=1 Tax=Hyperolius marmoratus TaxID=476017 RepID=W0THT6_HYPMR|nr:ATP synthase F0 subunit 6 [Hyperolius marmoratus]BAO42915.1 ATPase subunit 6 [Hyperolius marmoratus]